MKSSSMVVAFSIAYSSCFLQISCDEYSGRKRVKKQVLDPGRCWSGLSLPVGGYWILNDIWNSSAEFGNLDRAATKFTNLLRCVWSISSSVSQKYWTCSFFSDRSLSYSVTFFSNSTSMLGRPQNSTSTSSTVKSGRIDTGRAAERPVRKAVSTVSMLLRFRFSTCRMKAPRFCRESFWYLTRPDWSTVSKLFCLNALSSASPICSTSTIWWGVRFSSVFIMSALAMSTFRRS
mmetsp:Transcript_59782/g.81741  ORF Transcript_59782/g.81741 Transcript_59782/m.81741 type:complete len:233 (-) Transcript_59782:275-973(-)